MKHMSAASSPCLPTCRLQPLLRCLLPVAGCYCVLCCAVFVCAQVNHRDEWLQCLRATFDAMDADKDGRLKPSEILEALRDKLPEAEVRPGQGQARRGGAALEQGRSQGVLDSLAKLTGTEYHGRCRCSCCRRVSVPGRS
jgi:hypothetical protein